MRGSGNGPRWAVSPYIMMRMHMSMVQTYQCRLLRLDSSVTPPGNCGHSHMCLCVCQGVDIFEKDFLFLPIHDHLHWSLVIVCHAGAPSEEDSCTPWILHLDSMTCESPCNLETRQPICASSPCFRVVRCPERGTVMLRALQLIVSHLSLCSWSLHPEDKEGAAGVPHAGVGPQGAVHSPSLPLLATFSNPL